MKDNYVKSFEAKVIGLGDNYVVLDQTAFYPLGGGQESDSGKMTFNDTTVTIKRVKKEKGEVRHYLAEKDSLPKLTEEVTCELDWDKRYTHMRFHTAIHVLSSYMLDKYNAEVVGNNISVRSGRADFNLDDALTDEELAAIEEGINEIIDRNLDVKISFMPREDAISFLQEKGYQTDYINMVPESVKTFRVVSVGDHDHASCAGTHVANTSEIGKIRVVKRRSMGKGKERIILALG
jgi:misacylated tRNA(Ala) deacylase